MPRIPIEQKHTYSSIETELYGSSDNGNLIGDTVKWQVLNYPNLGVDENERIGRKIHTDYISYETFYSLQTNYTLANGVSRVYDLYLDEEAKYYNNVDDNEEGQTTQPVDADKNSLQSPLNITFREFLVEFDPDLIDYANDEETQNYLLTWYQQLVVQTAAGGVASNRQQIKRESTNYTGTFRILKDKLHHINFQKQVVHDFGTIEYKRNLNFADDVFPTQGLLLRFWIGPQNIFIDYGNQAFGVYIQAEYPDQISILTIRSTMKLSYSDV